MMPSQPVHDELLQILEPVWLEWYRMTPEERWRESEKLWQHYLSIGGSLDPEPDTQSPFFDPDDPREASEEERRADDAVRELWRVDMLANIHTPRREDE